MNLARSHKYLRLCLKRDGRQKARKQREIADKGRKEKRREDKRREEKERKKEASKEGRQRAKGKCKGKATGASTYEVMKSANAELSLQRKLATATQEQQKELAKN